MTNYSEPILLRLSVCTECRDIIRDGGTLSADGWEDYTVTERMEDGDEPPFAPCDGCGTPAPGGARFPAVARYHHEPEVWHAYRRDAQGVKPVLTIESVGGDAWTKDGYQAEKDDTSAERQVVVYLDSVDAWREQSIEGSSIEHAGDGRHYTMVSVANTEDRLDVLTARLTAAGYTVRHGAGL
jgi:hypothetical protein